MKQGIAAIRSREIELTRVLMDGIRKMRRVTVYGPEDANARAAIVSFTASDHRVSEIGLRLDEEFGILSRVGLHCAPAAHRMIGTFPEGTVRFALGASTTRTEVLAAIDALDQILERD